MNGYDEAMSATHANPEDLSAAARHLAAAEGEALPDGSFPVRDLDELHKAIHAVGRSKHPIEVRRYLIRRARDLGATELIPQKWFDELEK